MTPAERVLALFDRISEAPDAIPRLRRFVLDLAVRGMLVTQNLDDEPASNLLVRIQAAKHESGIKTARLSAVDEMSVPFPARRGWIWTRIGDVTSNRGQTVPNEPFTYIDVTSIDKDLGQIANAKVLSAKAAPSRARKCAAKGDVLYSCVRPYLLNVAIIDCSYSPPPIASTAFAVLNGFGLIIPKYIWTLLRSPLMVSLVEAKMRGQAYPSINDSDFRRLPFPLAPLAEQQRIVAKVDELMALCDRLEAAQKSRASQRDQFVNASFARVRNSTTPELFGTHLGFCLRLLQIFTETPEVVRQLRKELLEFAFQGKLTASWRQKQRAPNTGDEFLSDILTTRRRLYGSRRGSDPVKMSDDELPQIPRSWTWASCDMVCSQITDGEHIQPPYQASGIPMLTAKHVRDGYVTFDGCQMISISDFLKCISRCKPEKGDILIVSVGATTGRSAIVTQPEPFAIVRSVLLLKPLVDARFLLCWLQTPWCLHWMRHASEASAQPHLYIGDTKRMPVPIPPIEEQEQIVGRVDELMAICDRIEARLEIGRTNQAALLDVTLREVLNLEGRGEVPDNTAFAYRVSV